MNSKAKYVIASCLVILMLLSFSQVFLETNNVQAQTFSGDRASWLGLATNAWAYFQPGTGVNALTGLHGSGLGWPYFTEWDLGTYIQAIIDAKQLGLIQNDGLWGFNYRIELILNFLKTRQLTSNGLPYLTYDSGTGQPYEDTATFHVDEGKLYMALYDLEVFRPDLTADVALIINRNNNTALLPDPVSLSGSTDFYNYYVSTAFKDLGFSGYADVPSLILNTIVSQPNVTTYGVELPSAHICCEPLLLAFFEINPQDSRYTWLLSQVNLAQEARYEAIRHYTAFSEGNTGLGNPSYVYEFVIDMNGSAWVVAPRITPIAYLKVAVGFDAIFDTTYTQNMVDYILGSLPTSNVGFQEGVAEDGRVVGNVIDRTNGLVLAAALYAISNMPASTPSPTLVSPNSSANTVNSSPSVSSHFSWLNTPTLIVIAVVITILFVILPLTFLLKRNHFNSRKKIRTLRLRRV